MSDYSQGAAGRRAAALERQSFLALQRASSSSGGECVPPPVRLLQRCLRDDEYFPMLGWCNNEKCLYTAFNKEYSTNGVFVHCSVVGCTFKHVACDRVHGSCQRLAGKCSHKWRGGQLQL
jgi:hypothetical protein